MAKGLLLKGDVAVLIAMVCQAHEKWTAKTVKYEVERIIQEEVAAGKRPPTSPGWPGISAVQKVITALNKIKAQSPVNPVDKLWSVAALRQHEVTPEALLIVMKAWARGLQRGSYLTIREAIWISRIYAIFPYLPDFNKVTHYYDTALEPDDVVTIRAFDVTTEVLDEIIATARRYANQEKAIEATGAYPVNADDALRLWIHDAGLYAAVSDDLTPLREIRDTIQKTIKEGGTK